MDISIEKILNTMISGSLFIFVLGIIWFLLTGVGVGPFLGSIFKRCCYQKVPPETTGGQAVGLTDLSKWFFALVGIGAIYATGAILEHQSYSLIARQTDQIRLRALSHVLARGHRGDLTEEEQSLSGLVETLLKGSAKSDEERAEQRHMRIRSDAYYYRAKNVAYGTSTYFSELQDCERRISFLRTLIVTAIALSLAGVLGFILKVISRLVKADSPSRNPPSWRSSDYVKHLHQLSLGRVIVLAVVGLIVWWLTYPSWGREQFGYDMRCLGYYLDSAAKSDRDHTSESGHPENGEERQLGGPYGFKPKDGKLINFRIYRDQSLLHRSEVKELSYDLLRRSLSANKHAPFGADFQKYNYVIKDGKILVAVWGEEVDIDQGPFGLASDASSFRSDPGKSLGYRRPKGIMIDFYAEDPALTLHPEAKSPCWIAVPDREDFLKNAGVLDAMSKHFMICQGEGTTIEDFDLKGWKETKVDYAGEILVDVKKKYYVVNNNSGTYQPNGAYLEKAAELFEDKLGYAPKCVHDVADKKLRIYEGTKSDRLDLTMPSAPDEAGPDRDIRPAVDENSFNGVGKRGLARRFRAGIRCGWHRQLVVSAA